MGSGSLPALLIPLVPVFPGRPLGVYAIAQHQASITRLGAGQSQPTFRIINFLEDRERVWFCFVVKATRPDWDGWGRPRAAPDPRGPGYPSTPG